MKISRLPILFAVSVSAISCTSGPTEEVGRGEGAIKRVVNDNAPEPADPVGRPPRAPVSDPIDPPPPPPPAPDAGTDDSRIKLLGEIAAAADLPCTTTLFDIVASGRTCAAFAKTTTTGTWSAGSSLPGAPAAIRDTHCLLIWTPTSACAAPDYAALGMSCVERRTFTAHRECASGTSCAATGEILTTKQSMPAGAEPCPSTSGPVFFAAPPPKDPPDPPPGPDPWDGGTPGGYVGGCDACGIVNGGNLYITNPYGATTILVNVTPVGTSTPQQLQIQAPATSTFAYPIGSGYQQTTAFVWK